MRTCESCAYSKTDGHRIYECVNPESRRHMQTVGRPVMRVISEFLAPRFEMVWSFGCGHYRKG